MQEQAHHGLPWIFSHKRYSCSYLQVSTNCKNCPSLFCRKEANRHLLKQMCLPSQSSLVMLQEILFYFLPNHYIQPLSEITENLKPTVPHMSSHTNIFISKTTTVWYLQIKIGKLKFKISKHGLTKLNHNSLRLKVLYSLDTYTSS